MAWTGCVSGTLAASFVGLFLLAVGFSIPLWTSFEQKDATDNSKVLYTVHIGVWYLMACKDGESGSCKSAAIAVDLSSKTDIRFDFPGADNSEAVELGSESLGNDFNANSFSICGRGGEGD